MHVQVLGKECFDTTHDSLKAFLNAKDPKHVGIINYIMINTAVCTGVADYLCAGITLLQFIISEGAQIKSPKMRQHVGDEPFFCQFGHRLRRLIENVFTYITFNLESTQKPAQELWEKSLIMKECLILSVWILM